MAKFADVRKNALGAKNLEDYANNYIPKEDKGFGDFMHHVNLLRKNHINKHLDDLNMVDSKWLHKMKEILGYTN
ncbi:MAG: hypothetical protein EBU90_24750 [Proteobacteria bacterium]|nr:hypothetical protein [Pseudomonadota bacterium]